VVQRRCYYAIEPFGVHYQVIYKYQRKKKGKPVEKKLMNSLNQSLKKKKRYNYFGLNNTY
jgi:hypothetical protein